MTVLTMPVQPGRDTGAAPGPVPVAGNAVGHLAAAPRPADHRPAVFVAAVAFMLITGPKIHHDYATLMACHPAASAACLQLSNGFNTDWHLGNGIRVALLAAPVLLALFAGPPVVARELENGTFRYAWTQGIGRVRWTVAKLAFLGSVVTIAALAASQLFTWLFAPFLTQQNLTVLTPAVFETRGVVYAAWTLTAFCLGAFLGTLLRRVLPAMAATLGVYLALAAATWSYLQQPLPGQHVLAHAGLRGRLAPRPVGAARRGHRPAGPPVRRVGPRGYRKFTVPPSADGLAAAGSGVEVAIRGQRSSSSRARAADFMISGQSARRPAAVGLAVAGARRRAWLAAQAAGSGGERKAAGAGMARKIAAPPLKPSSASAASTTAAEVQLDRSAGKWFSLTYCQPVQ